VEKIENIFKKAFQYEKMVLEGKKIGIKKNKKV
jgi:hypothetical protein